MADIKITLNNIGSNSRFGGGWDTVKATDTNPFSDYAKQAVKFIIKIALKPFKSIYSFVKATINHKKPIGQWRKETDTGDSVWYKVVGNKITGWRKE